MRPLHLRPLLSAVLTLVLVLATAPPAAGEAGDGSGGDPGTVGVALLEAPTARADDPRALVYVVDHLSPGDVIERRIGVTNSTDSAVEVDLYAGAAEITDRGWAPIDGRATNEATSWTTMTPQATTVPVGGTTEATIRVVVPDDATPGEHYAVAWVQLPIEPGGTIDVVHRVGIRMYLSVGDGDEPVSDFVIRSVQAATDDDGRRTLDVTVDNTGGRAVDVSGEVMLAGGPGGSTAGPFRSPSGPTLAPGDTGVLSLPIPADLPDGTWNAQILARSGVLERRAEVPVSWSEPAGPVEVVQQETDLGGGVSTPTDRSFGDVGTLVVSLLAIALLMAVTAAAAHTHRRQRRPAVQR